MGAIVAGLNRLARIWKRVRLRVWQARTRVSLGALGCDFELILRGDVQFHTLPTIEPTRQGTGKPGGGQGSVRIEVGRWTHLGRDLTIEVDTDSASTLVLDDGLTVGSGVRLILFGGEIGVGAWTRLRDGVTLKSSGRLVIGEHAILQNQCMVQCAESVILEERVTCSERVTVIDSDHLPDGSGVWHQEAPLGVAPVHIGRNTWVAANAVVLRGVRLGANSVVAAASVVRDGDYPEGWLLAGAPAETKRPLDAARRAKSEM